MTEEKDPFAAYRLPLSLAQGVWIDLADTGARFLVAPPASVNEAYQAAFVKRLTSNGYDETGAFKPAPVEKVAGYSREAFVEACIIEAEGVGDMKPKAFFAKYPLALKIIHERASELAEAVEKEVQEALGNSPSTPSGSSLGVDASSNMSSSKAKASQQAASLN